MNRPRLSKSGVEYLDYSWGVWSGCRNLEVGICPVKACWAKGIANHYPKLYPNGFDPTYYPEAINSPKHLKKPSIISVGWVGDVIGYGLEHKEEIFDTIYNCPQHTFLFLTKNPERLLAWGDFPDNCWVGVSATGNKAYHTAIEVLSEIDAKIKYLSIEPFLERIVVDDYVINAADWLIIGSQTKPTVYPKIEWVQEIVNAADGYGIPVFLKNNLAPLFPDAGKDNQSSLGFVSRGKLRQEMPK